MGKLPGASASESEFQCYAFMGARDHRPDYGAGSTLKDGAEVGEWGGYPIYASKRRDGSTHSSDVLNYWNIDGRGFSLATFAQMVGYGD